MSRSRTAAVLWLIAGVSTAGIAFFIVDPVTRGRSSSVPLPRYLPMLFGLRALGGRLESHGRGAFVVAEWMLVAVSLLDVIAGVLLWRRRRSGVLLGLATDPIALALGWGFALPLLLIAVPVRGLLVIVGLRRIQ